MTKGKSGYEIPLLGDRICLEIAAAREIGTTYLVNRDKANAQKLIRATESLYGIKSKEKIFELFKQYIAKEWE